MPSYTIRLIGEPLDVNAAWTVEQFHQAALNSISGAITSSNIITGRAGGSAPTSDIGPWIDNGVLKMWLATRTVSNAVTNGTTTITSATIAFTTFDVGKTISGTNIPANTVIQSVTNATTAIMSAAATGSSGAGTLNIIGNAYFPVIPTVGSNGFFISLVGSPTANREITLQDKDGIVALTTDVYTPRGTDYPTMRTPPDTTVIDWSLTSSFGLPLDKDIVISNTNSVSGQEVHIVAYNAAAAIWTIDWTSSGVHWPGGAAPVTSTDDKTTMFVLRNVGGVIYGAVEQPYA